VERFISARLVTESFLTAKKFPLLNVGKIVIRGIGDPLNHGPLKGKKSFLESRQGSNNGKVYNGKKVSVTKCGEIVGRGIGDPEK
jgi:hypothetical protein